ncbi:MAG: hypothetical protein ACTJGH_04655 [Peptoniphilaceae bacterium]
MEKIIKRIYELMHSPIITPYNLLENAKLDNYNYVNYYKGEMGLIVEMECSMGDSMDAIFYYYFDANDKLIKIYEEVKGQKNIVFDREKELANVSETYITKNKEYINSKVV